MTTDTVQLHHDRQGPSDAPAVFLGGSLGTTLAMWDGLAERLAGRYQVIRFDTRGHGASPAPAGPYTMSELASDVVGLADELGLRRFSYVGLSLGGGIGQAVAVEHPERVASLVLCCTAPVFGDAATWRERSLRVTAEGMGWLVDATRERWFTPEFLKSDPKAADRILDMLASTSPVGYAACCDALAAYDLSGRLTEITAPTRVIAAAQDPVTPPEVTSKLAEGIPGADHVVVDDAAHIVNIAQPEAFGTAVEEHLDRTVGA